MSLSLAFGAALFLVSAFSFPTLIANGQVRTGSIRVCTAIADDSGTIITEKSVCEPGADWVLSFRQGVLKSGNPVPSPQSNISQALGLPEHAERNNFVSLGFGGEIVLGFSNFILNENGTAADFELVSSSNAGRSCEDYPATARISASQDGTVWTDLGTTCFGGGFDLGALSWARYIKVTDISDVNDSHFDAIADGFRLDGVRALRCVLTPPATAFTFSSFIPQGDTNAIRFPTSIFNLPLSYNSKIFETSDGQDSQCFDFAGLPIAEYYYHPESLPDNGWLPPRYNDNVNGELKSSSTFTTYDNSLFDGDSSNDNPRNYYSDGRIDMNDDQLSAVVLILNQIASTGRRPIILAVPTSTLPGIPNTGAQVITPTSSDAIANTAVCEPLISNYLGFGRKNDPQNVKKLQRFLKGEIEARLSENGIFDKATFQAVKDFQLKYANEILGPWVGAGLKNIRTPTGFVYKTTLKKINELSCSS